jgi:methylase of polypeptide subunit release factors
VSDLLEPRIALLQALKMRDYHFITPTPATHARVVARRREATDLRDILGWSLPFRREIAGAELIELMRAAGVLEQRGDLLASKVRVSRLGADLFLHSAYPTTQQDAVFFGPDSYRFARFIWNEAPKLGRRKKIADIGAGTGVGGLNAWRALAPAWEPDDLIGTTMDFNDINELAIGYAAANVIAADGIGGASFFAPGDASAVLSGPYDLIVANPPYIADAAHRTYRDGGAMHGAEVSLRWAALAADKLERNGVLLLYTGSAVVGGVDRLKLELERRLRERALDVDYRELDPDVFGEELEREDYADVERIAVVGVVATKR